MAKHDETAHVGIEYEVVDHASSPMHRMGESAHHLYEKMQEVRKETGLTTTAMLGIGVGLGAWIEKTKEVNNEFIKTQRSLSGLYVTGLKWSKGSDFMDNYAASTKLAAEATEELDKLAARFGGSLGEVGSMYQNLGQAVGSPLGLSRSRLMELTEHARATAKVLGIEGEAVVEKIGTALFTKHIRVSDQFGKFLARALHTTNLRGLSSEQILERMDKAMTKMVPAADALSQGIGDTLNRIRNSVDDMLRKLTSPLFKEIAKYLNDWNEQLSKVSENGETLLQTYGEKLASLFRMFLEVSGKIHEHWKAIAAVWAISKMGGGLGGVAGLLGGKGAAGMAGEASGAAGLLGKFSKELGVATLAIGAFVAAEEVAKVVDEGQTRKIQSGALMEGTVPAAVAAMQKGSLRGARSQLSGGGLLDASGNVNVSALANSIQLGSSQAFHDLHKSLDVMGDPEALAEAFARRFAELQKLPFDMMAGVKQGPLFDLTEAMGGKIESDPMKFAKTGAPQVNINHLEIKQNFEDVDPDRVFLRFADDLHQMATRTTGAGGAFSGGGG